MSPWIDLLPVVMSVIASIVDLRRREIPDTIWIVILVMVPIRIWFLWPAVSPWHLVIGAIAALLLGCLVGRGDRFGGGDVKLFAALGAWFGIAAVVPLALWAAVAGLPLAIIAAWRGQTDFAYGPAIAIGVLTHWLSPNLLGQLGGWA
ncbi:A24 family peptidase [Rhodopirellula sp. MGV]|uniref:prepilin peptidase n=1 Tax=Rhodopirellula sp. MGV TaxID=2023130 RepID=UPI0013045DE1|nr:A24 family peptidase [Rhodopirellula sp. MGV]